MRRAHRMGIGLALLLACGAAAADPITIVVALTSIVGSTAATIIANVLVFAATYGAALLTIGSYVYSGYQRRKQASRMREAALVASLQNRYVMAAMTDGARSRVYGEVRNVDGIIFKGVHGPNNETYTLLISVAGHEVEAIGDVYFGDLKVMLDGSGYVQDAPYKDSTSKISSNVNATLDGSGNGSVTLPNTPITGTVTAVQGTGPGSMNALTVSVNYTTRVVTISGGTGAGLARVYYQYTSGVSNARVRKYLGGPSQDMHAMMAADFPEITVDDRFAGDAMLRVDLTYSQESFTAGVPSISAVVKGAKVYDPRTSTTAWTDNPALIARDWSLYQYGGGLASGQIDDASFIAAANACDVSHEWHFPGLTLLHLTLPEVTVTDELYRCGIVCKLEGSPTPWMDEIVESMAGRYGWSGGKLRVVAGAWRAPVADIDESWLNGSGDVTIVPEPSINDAINTYRATIAHRDDNYVVQPLAPVVASAYLAADGMELAREVEMQGVTTTHHAQHIGGVVMREARQGLTVNLPCKLHAYQLELFDVVTVTIAEFGWSSKTFEVLGWGWSGAGGIDLQLKETNAEIYDPDADFSNLGNSDNTNLPDASVVPELTGLSVESGTTALVDGSIITRTRVSWTAASNVNVSNGGKVDVQYIEASDTLPAGDWPGTTEDGAATESIIPGLRAGVVYLFRARFRTPLARGVWSTHVSNTIASPPAASIGGTLSLPSAVVAADSSGVVASFAGAGGTFAVVRNTAPVTPSLVTFSVQSETGVDVSINSSGVYTINSMSADSGTAVFRAVYDGATLDRAYSIAKSRAGTDAPTPDPAPAPVITLNAFGEGEGVPATASVTFKTNGTTERIESGVSVGAGPNWYSPTTTSVGSGYWIRPVRVGGTVDPTGLTLNVWTQLSSNRSLTITRSTAGSSSSDLAVDVASDSAGATVVASHRVSLSAFYTP